MDGDHRRHHTFLNSAASFHDKQRKSKYKITHQYLPCVLLWAHTCLAELADVYRTFMDHLIYYNY